MQILAGFLIAVAMGLTGIGGGSFTVPVLVLWAGLPAGEAVGTAFVFAGVMRLIAAPFYMASKHVHSRYLWLLLQGAIPGLLLGTYLLRIVTAHTQAPIVVIVLGLLLTIASSVSFAGPLQNPGFARENPHWLRWLALPIGLESGFSSAGAGALGAVLLLNYSEISPAQVVGTDLLFGSVLAVIGSAFHWGFGTISGAFLWQLLAGGVPGVLVGCFLAPRVSGRKIKAAVALIAIFAGLQLVWSGVHGMLVQRSAASISNPAAPNHKSVEKATGATQKDSRIPEPDSHSVPGCAPAILERRLLESVKAFDAQHFRFVWEMLTASGPTIFASRKVSLSFCC